MTADAAATGPFAPPDVPVARRWTWPLLRRLATAVWRAPGQFRRPRLPRTCPICGYHGVFVVVGHPPRWDARCRRCGSCERHRLTHLWVTEGGGNRLAGRRVLHFAPKKVVLHQMRDTHFSAPDHHRYYGLDFADRLAKAGFRVDTFRLPPDQEVRYGLLRDEWLTIARKPV